MARILAVLVIATATVGVGEHVYATFDAGSLDHRYAATWDRLPLATRWWLAISKTVGPSPPLAPGALAQAGICVLLATVRHPALTSRHGGRQRQATVLNYPRKGARPYALKRVPRPVAQFPHYAVVRSFREPGGGSDSNCS